MVVIVRTLGREIDMNLSEMGSNKSFALFRSITSYETKHGSQDDYFKAILEKNSENLDMAFADFVSAHCYELLKAMHPSECVERRAGILCSRFGHFLIQQDTVSCDIYAEIALSFLKIAEKILKVEDAPFDWFFTLRHLSKIYNQRQYGDICINETEGYYYASNYIAAVREHSDIFEARDSSRKGRVKQKSYKKKNNRKMYSKGLLKNGHYESIFRSRTEAMYCYCDAAEENIKSILNKCERDSEAYKRLYGEYEFDYLKQLGFNAVHYSDVIGDKQKIITCAMAYCDVMMYHAKHKKLSEHAFNISMYILDDCMNMALQDEKNFSLQIPIVLKRANSLMVIFEADGFKGRDTQIKHLYESIRPIEHILQEDKDVSPIDEASLKLHLAMLYDYVNNNGEFDEQIMAYAHHAIQTLPLDFYSTSILSFAKKMADTALFAKNWQVSVGFFDIALMAYKQVTSQSISERFWQKEKSQSYYLDYDAAYANLMCNNYSRTIEILETSRSRQLDNTFEIKRQHPDLYEGYCSNQEVIAEVYQKTEDYIQENEDKMASIRDPEVLRFFEEKQRKAVDEFPEIRKKYNELSENIRQPQFEDICNAIPVGIPVVYIVMSFMASFAVILYKRSESSDAEVSWLELEQLDRIKFIEKMIVLSSSEEAKTPEAKQPSWTEIYEALKSNELEISQKETQINYLIDDLGQTVMKPINDHLDHFIEPQDKNVQRVILIPMGFLAFLPLHAAYTGEYNYLSDQYNFVYAPNVRSFKNSDSQYDISSAFCLIKKGLKHAHREAAIVCDFFDGALKYDTAHSKEDILKEIGKHHLVHFSCHGQGNIYTPYESGIMLDENTISIHDILNLPHKSHQTQLYILSACETAVPGILYPDETVTMSSALLQSGAKGIIATNWAVDDFSTTILVTMFYHYWRTEACPPSVALWKAQKWMRETDNRQKAQSILNALQSDTIKETKQCIFNTLAETSTNYAHPYHWAGFTYTGL